MRGLRFLHVGDRDQAHLKTLLRLFQLAGDGRAVGALRGELVLRAQHREIGLRGAQHGLLQRGFEVRFALRQHVLRSAQRNDGGPVEDGLAQGETPSGGRGVGRAGFDDRGELAGRRGRVEQQGRAAVAAGVIAGCVDFREQHAAGLRPDFPGGHQAGLGLAQQRIAHARLFIHLKQVVRRSRKGHAGQGRERGEQDELLHRGRAADMNVWILTSRRCRH